MNFTDIGQIFRERIAAHERDAAWYSGDPGRLARVSPFWKSDERHKVHVPVAADIAGLSAALLFSESPRITAENPVANRRLQALLSETGFFRAIVMAAEMQSAFGGVFLKLNWDAGLCRRPIVSCVPGSAGAAITRMGVNTENIFFSDVRRDEKTGVVWRLVERYTPDGGIASELYRGTQKELGRRANLSDIPETAGIPPEAKSLAGRLLSVYIPNRLPRRDRPSDTEGESDFSGLYGLFDALDQAYSGWARDVRLSKTRVIVPVEFLRKKGSIRSALESMGRDEWVFSGADEVFTALDMDPDGHASEIKVVQPSIRAAEFDATTQALLRRIYLTAGYSPRSAGLDDGGLPESGAALKIRERRSFETIGLKQTHWWHALTDFAGAILALDRAVFGSDAPDSAIAVEFPDPAGQDIAQLAGAVKALHDSGAAGDETLIRMLHPDWPEEEIRREADAARASSDIDPRK